MLTSYRLHLDLFPTTVEDKLIFRKQDQHVHSSSIVEIPDGTLLAAWFQGSGECKADDVCIMGARKADALAQWSEPFVLADTPGHPDCNPVLWVDQEKRLWLFWSAILSNEWESSLVKYRVSSDYVALDGPPRWDWQDNVHVKPTNFQSQMLGNWQMMLGSVNYLPRAIQAELSATTLSKLLRKDWELILIVSLVLTAPVGIHWWRRRRTGLGGWKRYALRATLYYTSLATIAAVGAFGYFALSAGPKLNQRLGWLTANKPVELQSGEIVLPLYSDRFLASIMAISADGGKSWEASQPIVGYGSIQPSLIERKNGDLVVLMRENGVRKRIRYSVSTDQGRQWSDVQETALPNPGSKINVIALATGEWMLAYNNLLDGRHTLSLAISRDEGNSWQPYHRLEKDAPGLASFSYPCLLETYDRQIHVTYSQNQAEGKSIKHVSLRQPTP